MALEVTANRKKKASTVTPEDDLTDVSDAELTIPVTQAVTGPIALSPQTPSASVQVDPEIVELVAVVSVVLETLWPRPFASEFLANIQRSLSSFVLSSSVDLYLFRIGRILGGCISC